jgi:hypothetical protein
MGIRSVLQGTVLLVVAAWPWRARSEETPGETAEEPQGGAGVSPIEIVPRVELRHTFLRLPNDVSIHDTIAEIDIQFLRRLLLRYELPVRLLSTPQGQISGRSDMRLTALGILASDRTHLVALLAGAALNTASQPQLGAGKPQVFLGGGAAIKPYRWWLAYGVVQQQFSVGGDDARPDINELDVRLGAIVFGKQYNWLKADLDTTVDFPGQTTARLFGTLEAGSLVVGRVGLFVRGGSQLLGDRQVEYTITGGARYLFRLETSRPQPGAAPARGD